MTRIASPGATAAATKLKGAGFDATVGQGMSAQPTTEIRYAKGMESEAKTLTQYVPGASVLQSDVRSVTLVLGSDHLKVLDHPKPPKSHSSGSGKTKKAIDRGCIN